MSEATTGTPSGKGLEDRQAEALLFPRRGEHEVATGDDAGGLLGRHVLMVLLGPEQGLLVIGQRVLGKAYEMDVEAAKTQLCEGAKAGRNTLPVTLPRSGNEDSGRVTGAAPQTGPTPGLQKPSRGCRTTREGRANRCSSRAPRCGETTMAGSSVLISHDDLFMVSGIVGVAGFETLTVVDDLATPCGRLQGRSSSSRSPRQRLRMESFRG